MLTVMITKIGLKFRVVTNGSINNDHKPRGYLRTNVIKEYQRKFTGRMVKYFQRLKLNWICRVF